MMRHHPSSELLAAYANGTLRPGAALVVACHVDACRECRREMSLLDALGGALLARSEPAQLSEGALERALTQIAAGNRPSQQLPAPPSFLAHFDVPDRLRAYEIGPRRRLTSNIWVASIAAEPGAKTCTYLVYAARNTVLPLHTHAGYEFTAVLNGAYRDGFGEFAAGDFVAMDGETRHAPAVTAEGSCLSLISSDGPMKLELLSARIIQAFMGRLY